MIKVDNITKTFEKYNALDSFSLSVGKGKIYGLVGTNGAGKSTLLRILAGVYKQDGGGIFFDDENIFENVSIKSRIFLVPDDLYFLPGSDLTEMGRFYAGIYSGWSWERFEQLVHLLPIHPKKKIRTFSKGMMRQSAIILALSARPDLLLLDEAFDGIDPVIRVAVRKLISDDVSARGMTVIISSHNLREIEDFCESITIMHKGKLLVNKEIDELKTDFCKVQVAFNPPLELSALSELKILSSSKEGSIHMLIIEGAREDILTYLRSFNPVVLDCVPLSLEEVFIHEMEVVGYDYNNILF